MGDAARITMVTDSGIEQTAIGFSVSSTSHKVVSISRSKSCQHTHIVVWHDLNINDASSVWHALRRQMCDFLLFNPGTLRVDVVDYSSNIKTTTAKPQC